MRTISTVLFAFLPLAVPALAADPAPAWPTVRLTSPDQVEIRGELGDALQRGIHRIALPPYAEDWVLADVSFKVNRIFTNYSGDVSGRFLELAALTSPGKPQPAILPGVMAAIAAYQKADGHFGVDIDLTKPLPADAPPIPMLWGNGRLLVGLVTAAQRFHDEKLMAAARRLGDFYVTSATELCNPVREADYRRSGSYGGSYTCCYFPGMEGLIMLYQATKDDRYLKQAERMAEWFYRFDALPIEHSHGNLCAWRSILMLYETTGKPDYLRRAKAKWDTAMTGGYVWPIGGIGEHFFVNFNVDEGCSESDWLRFAFDLWRFTGDTRYLDIAERLLGNQYAANQSANGGYGARHFHGHPGGPTAIESQNDEWNYCCNFHGPLGLYFAKAYLATASDRGIFINFPTDFTSAVKTPNGPWRVNVERKPHYLQGRSQLAIELAALNGQTSRQTLWVRVPGWAHSAELVGDDAKATLDNGYLRIEREFKKGQPVVVELSTALGLEGRKFATIHPESGKTSRLEDVAILAGPQVLFAAIGGTARPALLAMVNADGKLELPFAVDGAVATVALPSTSATPAEIATALREARPVHLRPWSAALGHRQADFMFDLLIVPADALPAADRARFAARAAQENPGGPFFGEELEKRSDIWQATPDWKFTPEGLRVMGGDIGLLDGDTYRDYRLEVEMVLPKEGQGITGVVVRATDPENCLMFQVQSADSTIQSAEFKTKPNTLRPHVRKDGKWTLGEAVALPSEVHRGEPHRLAIECRGDSVIVFFDGAKIFAQAAGERTSGTIGFRAAGSVEQGLFRHIQLKRL